jgi:hypothetical protein
LFGGYPSCYSGSGELLKAETLPTPNYGYEKRQRELAKKQKKLEKLKAKAERKSGDPHQDAEGNPAESEAGQGDPPAPAAPGQA